jgi:hypothetical protein
MLLALPNPVSDILNGPGILFNAKNEKAHGKLGVIFIPYLFGL